MRSHLLWLTYFLLEALKYCSLLIWFPLIVQLEAVTLRFIWGQGYKNAIWETTVTIYNSSSQEDSTSFPSKFFVPQ